MRAEPLGVGFMFYKRGSREIPSPFVSASLQREGANCGPGHRLHRNATILALWSSACQPPELGDLTYVL